MSTDFCTSKTKENLMRAFAGESQARNRYDFAAEQAKIKKQHVISALFKFTANQEHEHAEIFYNHLKQCAGKSIDICGGYPVDISEEICKLTEAAIHNETEEAEDVYPSFAAVAREEGFAKIAQDFENIAKIEKSHAQRFRKFYDLCSSGKLYKSDKKERWVCLNCGYILESEEAPQQCPVCGEEQGYFIRLDMASWGL
ncbi:MAG: rubrerythrin family protein [Ruminococcus sp.]|nr:rubrerythrin family protein [Ruminococcus sp.]